MEREAVVTLRIRDRERDNGTAGKSASVDLMRRPSPSIQASGIGGVGHGQYELESGGSSAGVRREMKTNGKPAYAVPSMADVRKLPWNGLKIASLFAGCGGSCTGYRMAGYKVAWANEFAPHAQSSYEANANNCVLDRRDVRLIKPQDILKACGLKAGELDLLDGSPPCQAFSTAGKREKGWGKEKKYAHGAKQRNEDLFQEYVRILRGVKPKVFVAENVSGLAKGTCKGMFIEILRALKESGYVVECRLLDAQWLGVPQSRQRLIFIGVRENLAKKFKCKPSFPSPLKWRYSVGEACPWIGSQAVERQGHGFFPGDIVQTGTSPSPSVRASGISGGFKVIHDVSGQHSQGDVTNKPSPAGRAGSHFVVTGRLGTGYKRKPVNLAGPMPAIMASGDAQTRFEVEKLPKHLRLDKSREALCDGDKRFGANGAAVANKPYPTVQTVSHDTVLVAERRKLTIAELRRICSFPDDFVLTGSYAQQWSCLGNSVPPLMAKAVGEAMLPILSKINGFA